MYRVGKSIFSIVFFVFVFVNCTEANIETLTLSNGQEALSYIIDNRLQVFDVNYTNNHLTIKHNKGSVEIDTNSLPFLCLNDRSYWTINGKVLSNKLLTDDTGNHIFPTLDFSSDGFLVIDGIKSNYSLIGNLQNDNLFKDSDICAVARIDSILCVYNYNGNRKVIPIIESPNHILPDYFFDHVVEKELAAEDYVKKIPTLEQLSYVFFTDVHWGRNQKHSPAIIKHIVDYTSIDYVLFGGDVNTTHTETIQETLDIGYLFHDAFSFLGSRLYCLYGNHDDNSTGQPSLTDRHLSEEQVYNYLQSQMTNVHYWDYYNFYYDDIKTKTRFICMDTGRLYNTKFREASYKTAQFAVECLSNVPEGWHIVAASHIWTNLKDFKTGEIKESVYVRPIIEILENYNLRKKSVFSYGKNSFEYDFSDAGAVVEYCIGGHTHSDGMVLSEKGIPLINVTCDGQQEVAGGAPYKTGTINEQCVTIIVNDYQDKLVKIFHIGRGEDVTINMWSSHSNANE